MLSFRIRRFEPADQKGVERLVLTIQQDEYGYQLTTENQPDLKDVAGFFASRNSAFWVAEGAGGDIIGCIGLMDLGSGACAMRKFMVAAPARGRDNGVSSALTQAFEDHARQYCPKLALSTVQKTAAAQAFYVREGYRIVDQSQLPEGFEAGPFDVVFMVKDLAKQPPIQ
jgi:N-acetylglutamate synthase-like GNAT family acetyltransferase